MLHFIKIFPKILFSKESYSHVLLSLKGSEQFLLSLPPGQICGNNKFLSSKYGILEPDSQILSIIYQTGM